MMTMKLGVSAAFEVGVKLAKTKAATAIRTRNFIDLHEWVGGPVVGGPVAGGPVAGGPVVGGLVPL